YAVGASETKATCFNSATSAFFTPGITHTHTLIRTHRGSCTHTHQVTLTLIRSHRDPAHTHSSGHTHTHQTRPTEECHRVSHTHTPTQTQQSVTLSGQAAEGPL